MDADDESATDWPLYVRFAKLSRPSRRTSDRNVWDCRIDADATGDLAFTSREALAGYQSTKYLFFSTLLAELAAAEMPDFTPRGSTSRFVGMPDDLRLLWDALHRDEIVAYLCRVAQIDQADVHLAWYNDLASFREWAEGVRQWSRVAKTETIARAINRNFPICIEEEDEIASALGELQGRLLSLLESPHLLASISAVRTDRGVDTLQKISRAIKESMTNPSLRMAELMQEILFIVRDAYGLEICDYLINDPRQGEQRLVLFASSHELSVEQLKEGEPAYRLAEGITGSAMLLRSDRGPRWIGTNNLELDLRQAPRHADLFRDRLTYGETYAFLVLPVFDGPVLLGALRAIDPHLVVTPTIEHGSRGVWPLTVRAELAQIVDWLGHVIPFLDELLSSEADDSPLAELGRQADSTWLSWASRRYLSQVLTHAVRLAAVKSEHRTIGCTLAISSEAAFAVLKGSLSPYPGVPDELTSGRFDLVPPEIFDRIPRGAGVFAGTIPAETSRPISASYGALLATTHLSTIDLAKEFESVQHLAFLDIDGELQVVSIYEAGKWIADYFMNEKTGRWSLRLRDNVRLAVDRLNLRSRRSEVLETLLFDFIIPYSYLGHGGMFLLSDRRPREQIARPGFHVGTDLAHLDLDQFTRISAIDGATWINFDGRVEQAGILFTSRPTSGGQPPSGGARHQAARTVLERVKDSVVVVVSANRRVSIGASGSDRFAII